MPTTELTTIRVADLHDPTRFRDVQGPIVAPGLATAQNRTANGRRPARNAVIHLPSGRLLGDGYCDEHALTAVDLAVAAGIDWTGDQTTVTAAAKADPGLIEALRRLRCADWRCPADQPVPPHWGVRCTVCGWEHDISHDGLITHPTDAREVSDRPPLRAEHRHPAACHPLRAPPHGAAGERSSS